MLIFAFKLDCNLTEATMIKYTIAITLAFLALPAIADSKKFSPFGINLSETSEFYPVNIPAVPKEPVKVSPPNPLEMFQTYNVLFDYDALVYSVEAIGDIRNSKYSCNDLAQFLNNSFTQTYPEAEVFSYNGAIFAYQVKTSKTVYQASIGCQLNNIIYIIEDMGLKDRVENMTRPAVQL